MSEAVACVPTDVARWLRPGERVVWADKADPEHKRWMPFEPMRLFLMLGLLLGLATAGTAAWSAATGHVSRSGVMLTGTLAVLTFLIGLQSLHRQLFQPRYALIERDGLLVFGMVVYGRRAMRFVIAAEPVIVGRSVDWGVVQVEELDRRGGGALRVRWRDVRDAEALVDLVTVSRRARTTGSP